MHRNENTMKVDCQKNGKGTGKSNSQLPKALFAFIFIQHQTLAEFMPRNVEWTAPSGIEYFVIRNIILNDPS